MKTIALILALSALSSAQTKPDVQLPPDVRTYQPRNISPEKADGLANSVRFMTNIGGVSWDGVTHVFIIRANKPELLDMAEALLKKYDVPPPRIELTAYLVRASTSPSEPAITPVPAEIKSAIDEMKGAFNYSRYGLWDSIMLPIKNAGEVQGLLPSMPGSGPAVYTIGYNTAGPPSESRTLSLAEFMFSVKLGGIDSHIKSDLTIREGEKLVLGKIRLLGANGDDLFLVLTTKAY